MEQASTMTSPPRPPLPPSGGLNFPFLLLFHTLTLPDPPSPPVALIRTCDPCNDQTGQISTALFYLATQSGNHVYLVNKFTVYA